MGNRDMISIAFSLRLQPHHGSDIKVHVCRRGSNSGASPLGRRRIWASAPRTARLRIASTQRTR